MVLGAFGIPVVADGDMHPDAAEIVDPDTKEVLGGWVVDVDGTGHTVEPPVLATLRAYPTCLVGTERPPPWRLEAPTYAETVDALGFEPLGLTGRTWLDVVSGWLSLDEGNRWVPLVPGR